MQSIMPLRIGQALRGARWNYRLVEALGNYTVLIEVFEAEMIPRVDSQLPKRWSVYQNTV
jgi:hypothetical protein